MDIFCIIKKKQLFGKTIQESTPIVLYIALTTRGNFVILL